MGTPGPAACNLCGCIPALPALDASPSAQMVTTKNVPLRVTVLGAQRCRAELRFASQERPSPGLFPFHHREMLLSSSGFLPPEIWKADPPPSEVPGILLLTTMRKPHCWDGHQTEKTFGDGQQLRQ